MNDFRKTFADPPASHRPAPLWVWNDLMSEEQIAAQLKDLKAHGFGGAFVHPRPGLLTEYLSDEWFRLWGFALETAKSLGLKLYIYDENSYPSGFAGGHVSALLPDCLASGMTYSVVDLIAAGADDDDTVHESNLPTNDPIAVFACREPDGRIEILEDISIYPANEWANLAEKVFVVSLVKPETTGWLAGFAYVDLLRPEVHEAFMQTTYEEYHKRFGADFGGAIPAIFTDEPYISSAGVYGSGAPALPFSYWLLNEFEKLNGYSLLKNLPAVFKNVAGRLDFPAEKIRYDYYKTLRVLWTKNSVEPSGRWCAEHGIAFTGHYLEHQWPHVGVNSSPSVQSNYEFHQWPAIDMLLSSYLRDTETHALTLTIQEIRSAANQFAKERTLCELYGAGGWDSTFEDYKRMGDWVLVNGINFINQHLTYATITGARKRDHPQSFDGREPWWEQYTAMNDYLSRASWLLSQGKMEQRILVLNPSTTGYLVPYEEEQGSIFSDGATDAIKNPDMHNFLELTRELDRGQWDWDLGDEFTMQRHAQVEGRRVRLCEQAYDVVLVSGDMKNMLTSTVALLRDFLQAGGRVIAVGAPGNYVDGLIDEAAYAELAGKWESVALADVDARLEALLGNRISTTAAFPYGFTHMRRALPDGREVYFFVNHSFRRYRTELTVKGDSACAYGLYTGETAPVSYTHADGKVTFPLDLARNQSTMIVVGERAGEYVSRPAAAKKVPLALKGIERELPNVLPIGYCDVRFSGRELKNVSVISAADVLFTARGFQKNPWDNKVQYFNNILDRNARYGEGSGFEADFHFNIAEGFAPAHIDVTAEHPELCRLRVNGKDVSWLAGEHYLDEHFGVADITELVQPGENTVTIVAEKFDARLELESVYLRGAFGVEAVEGRWTLVPETALGCGSWKEQKLPFYPYAVSYAYTAVLDGAPASALLEVTEVETTAVSARINGAEVLLNADGIRGYEIAPLLKAGENEIVVRVCGSLKNLLGPHFLPQPIRGSAWPAMWKQAPTHQPAPEACDLMDFGLNAAPELTIG